MEKTMGHRHTTRLALTLLLAASFLLSAGVAQASKQALVDITFKNTFFAAGYDFTIRSGGAWVTVNTTTTPTPTVKWPAGVLAGTKSFTTSGYYTPFSSVMETYMIKAGTLAKSHGGAAPSGGSTLVPTAGATNVCFASNAPHAPGPPALPGSCFPRVGTGHRAPGAKKYGGTVRMLRDTDTIATFVGSPSGLSLNNLHLGYSSALTGSPSAVGEYGVRISGTITNTILGTPRQVQGIETGAPFTTGTATVMGGAYATQITATGGHAFNTANLTGTISMVKPVLFNAFTRLSNGSYGGVANPGVHSIRSMSITFLPEPGATLLLGCGALGLIGIAALRRR